MKSNKKESLGIQRVSSVHIFVRDLERIRDWHVKCLDFAEIAVSKAAPPLKGCSCPAVPRSCPTRRSSSPKS